MSGGGEFFYNYLEYREFKGVTAGASFYSLLTAAYMHADSTNTAKIRLMWPDFADEIAARYNAPGGVLPDDWRPEPLGGAVPGEHGGLPEEGDGE